LALRSSDCVERLYLGDNIGYGSDKDSPRFMREIMQFAGQHPNMRVLDISTHGKPPKGVMELFLSLLGNNNTLTYLNISGYRIGDAGAVTLAKALSANTTLTQLAYDRNEITVTGWQCLAHVLERNTVMQHMDLPREDYRGQLTNFSKNTLAFAKLVQSQSDIARFCLRNYENGRVEAIVHSACILDVDAPSSSYSKPVPIKKVERSPAHTVPSVAPDEVHDDQAAAAAAEEEEEEEDPSHVPVTTTSLGATAISDDDDSDKNDDSDSDDTPPPPPPRS